MGRERELVEEDYWTVSVRRANGAKEIHVLRVLLYSDNTARFPELDQLLGPGDVVTISCPVEEDDG